MTDWRTDSKNDSIEYACLIDRSIDRSIDWLIDWLVGWLIDSFSEWFRSMLQPVLALTRCCESLGYRRSVDCWLGVALNYLRGSFAVCNSWELSMVKNLIPMIELPAKSLPHETMGPFWPFPSGKKNQDIMIREFRSFERTDIRRWWIISWKLTACCQGYRCLLVFVASFGNIFSFLGASTPDW